MAELQKSLKESQEALAVEARKSHAAQAPRVDSCVVWTPVERVARELAPLR